MWIRNDSIYVESDLLCLSQLLSDSIGRFAIFLLVCASNQDYNFTFYIADITLS